MNPTAASPGILTSSRTAYEIGSSKNASGTSIASGAFMLSTASTSSGYTEAQALFTATPVTLNAAGQYIEVYYTFTDTANTFNTTGTTGNNMQINIGLYNSGGSGPTNGTLLWNGGFGAGVSTATNGAAKGWNGYTAQFAFTPSGSSANASAIATRPAQAGTNNLNQGIGTGSSYLGGANVITMAGVAGQPFLTQGSQYTVHLRITYVNATTLAITNTLYNGSGIGGTVFSSSGWVGQFGATTTTILATSFDGLELGYRPTTSTATTLQINSITVAKYIPAPPTITGLTNQTVSAGSTATFSATVTGTPTPTLQWYYTADGGVSSNILAGETSSTLTLNNVSSAQNGYVYYLVANNSQGTVTSNMVLTVTGAANVPPSITGLASQSVNAGYNLTLNPTVTGSPTPNVRWLLNGVAIPNATSSSLTITNVRASQNGSVYTIIATNLYGAATNSMTLTVTNLQLTLNLDVNNSTGGNNYSGTAIAQDSGTVWNNFAAPAATTKTIVGATNSSGVTTTAGITITRTSGGNFSFWDGSGANGNPNPYALMRDYLFTGPHQVVVTNLPAGTYTVYVFAHGDNTSQASTISLDAANGGASGSTTDTGEYRNIYQANAAGNSYVALSGTVGSAGTFTFNTAYLNGFQLQYMSPAGVTGLTNRTVIAGTSPVLSPTITGTAPLYYQWSSNSVAIPGATNSTLTLTNVQYAQNGTIFSLVASNVAGADSNSMTLSVIVTPSITGLANQAIAVGANTTISPSVGGIPTPTLQWRYNGANLTDGLDANGSTISGSTTSSLGIVNAQAADSGTYSLVASNSAGAVTNSMNLIVSSTPVAPSITGPTNLTVIQGSNATFSASAIGLPVPTLQWLENGGQITDATNSTLTLTNVSYTQNGYAYSLVGSNSAGVVTNSATLTVLVPVSITNQPQNLTVTNTQAASFTVIAGGVPAPSYQWYFNGSAIGSANSATYNIVSAAPANVGNYTVVVSNSVNVVTSSVATLTVNSTMGISSLLPANGATAICYDTPLYLTFSQSPKLRRNGTIRIFNVTNAAAAVDTIDLSLCVTNGATYAANIQPYTINGNPFNVFPVMIAGNTAAIYPHQGVLTSNQTYYVIVDNGTFTDTAGAYFAGVTATNTWQFTTKVGGPISVTNLVVAKDYSGDFATVQGALNSIPSGNTVPTIINIRDGVYTEQININARHKVYLKGQSRSGTIVGYPNNNWANPGAPWRASFVLNGNDCTLDSLTITNMTPKGGSQAEAIDIEGTRAILYNIDLDSYQDTFLVHSQDKLVYIENCLVQGDTDFMWGYGTVYSTNCEIRGLSSGAHVTQPRAPYTTNGFGFINCRVTKGYTGSSTFDLGRTIGTPTTPSTVLFANCLMDDVVTGYSSDAGTNMCDYACSNLTATASKTVANSRHATSSDPLVIAIQSAPTWLYGWQPGIVPVITTQPNGASVSRGQSATLTVAASGIPVPSCQWQQNGTNIPNATGNSMTITNAQHASAGNYTVIVSNGSGSVTSSVATLTYNNLAPVAQPMTVLRTAGLNVKVAWADLATNWSDGDLDAVTLNTFSLVTTNGINLQTNSTWILCTNGPAVPDQINYSVRDGYGGTASGVITIALNPFVTGQDTTVATSGNSATLTFNGIPGYSYIVQRATNIVAPSWVNVVTSTVPDGGVLHVTDDFGDLQAVPSSAFYRLKWQP